MKLDLHIHSSYSGDGEFSPAQLMRMCSQKSIEVATLSDHNTVRGLEEAAESAAQYGITFLPGVELDCMLGELHFHLLGLGLTGKWDAFDNVEQEVHAQMVRNSDTMLAIFEEMGLVFDRDEVMARSDRGAVYSETVAEVVFQEVRNHDNPLVRPYLLGGAKAKNPMLNFYFDFCDKGRPAYVPVRYMEIDHAIDLIHQAGGVAVLAHPGHNLKGHEERLQDVVALGLDGIEVYSNYHDESKTAYFDAQAETFGLLKTMGSDFHGKTKPAIFLGEVGQPVPMEEIAAGLRKRGLL